MSSIKCLERPFDTAASTYEKLRSTYPDELYGEIFNYTTINASRHAVEEGIGASPAKTKPKA